MGTVTPLRFRPTVVVCVGEPGREVGAQLLPLLRSVDPARREGIAVMAAGDDTGALAGDWLDAADRSGAPDDAFADAAAQRAIPLELLVVEAFRGQEAARVRGAERRHGVLEDPIVWRIQDDGAAVPRALAVVWIAAAADCPALAEVVAATRRAAAGEHVECWVLLALTNVYPQDPDGHARQAARCAAQPWRDLLLGRDGVQSPVTYAYLFESHGEKATFWERPGDVAYAAAEAIFALAATGITTTHEYEETLRRSMPRMVREPQERLSGVGASRLTFPRAQAEQFCASQLGAAVLRAWQPPDAADERATGQSTERARAWLAAITRATAPSPARRRGGRPSPRLSAAGVRDALSLPRPDADGGLIFGHLRWETLDRLTGPRLELLPEVVREQSALAHAGVPTWQEAVRVRWERFEVETERELIAEVNDLALTGPAGLGDALGYVRALHDALSAARTDEQRAESRRRAAYRRLLDDLDASAGAADPQQSRSVPDAQALEAREDEVAERLATRYRTAVGRVPRVLALTGAGLAAMPPAVFVAQSLFMLVSPLLLSALLLVAFAAAGAGFYALRRREREAAASDLAFLARRRFAYRCEDYEHLRRVALLAGLLHCVVRMLARLEAWERFVEDLARELDRDAALVEHALFEGPAGRRDIFVANRQRLRRDGYTLRRFEQDVTRKRLLAPRDDQLWQRSNDEVLQRLLAALRGRVNVVGGDLSALKQPVREFCLGVIQPYLTGDLVSLAAALEAMSADSASGLVDALVERSVILYHPLDPPRPAALYVAARDDLRPLVLGAGRASGSVAVQIHDDEWLAAVRLGPGGARPSFWPVAHPGTSTAASVAPPFSAGQGQGA
ncbi:MAG: hypothetical protein ACHQ4H_01955 [Ktedonobacterales bacterium]